MREKEFEERIAAGRPQTPPSRVWFRENLRQRLVARHEELYVKKAPTSSHLFFWRLLFAGSALVLGVGFALVSRMYYFPRNATVPLASEQYIQDVASLGDLSDASVVVGGLGGANSGSPSSLPTYVFPDTLPVISALSFVYQPIVDLDAEAIAKLSRPLPEGFDLRVDAGYGVLNISRSAEFVSSVDEMGMFTAQTLPSHEEILAVARAAEKAFGLSGDLASFDAPVVLPLLPIGEGEEEYFYIARVVYPLRLDGAHIQQASGDFFGATIDINMNSMQVVGISVPVFSAIERAEYPLVTDKEKIFQRLRAMGYEGDVVMQADASLKNVRNLGVPDQVLIPLRRADGRDIFSSALRFPILEDVSLWEPQYLYVPLVGQQ